jgi:peptide-methionine (S)-S-oxide reductase
MEPFPITDPQFHQAVAALDAGDGDALERLLAEHPRLLRDRLDGGEGYFRQPYLLWFVAENPVRNGRLPDNIAALTRTLVTAAERAGVESLQQQLDYALALVCSGRVPRECGVQRGLIDVLVAAGAGPDGAIGPALAHRETAAVEALLEHGARRTLPVAAALGWGDQVSALGPAASALERQQALAVAALYGRAGVLPPLIELGVDLDADSPEGFHSHATALHLAVDSGSREAVRVLVEAGADRGIRDRLHQGTPLEWAEYLKRTEVAAYLRGLEGG